MSMADDFDLGPTDDYSGGTYPSGSAPDYSGDLDTGGGYAPGDPRALDPNGPGFSLGNIASLLKSAGSGLGLFDKNGNLNLQSLMSMLALAGSAAYGINRTSKANDQIQQALKDSNAVVTGTLGGNAAIYNPYQAAGQAGLQRLQAMPQSNLGTGAGLSLGNIARGQ